MSTVDEWPFLVSCQWLAYAMGLDTSPPTNTNKSIPDRKSLHVLDCSWYLPIANRDPKSIFNTQQFEQSHIPTSFYFPIDDHADHTYKLPHMLPTPHQFESIMTDTYGIDNNDTIVMYDGSGAFCASSRVWWTFLTMGHDVNKIFVLDGGMKEWRTLYPQHLQTGEASNLYSKATYKVEFHPKYLYTKQQILNDLSHPINSCPLLLDNREYARYESTAGEPRLVARLGHIPGAKSLFHANIQTIIETGRQGLKSKVQCKELFKQVGIDVENNNKPLIILYCGSGATAATVFWVLYQLNYHNLSLYDGSWAEWGNLRDTPIDQEKIGDEKGFALLEVFQSVS